MKTGKISEAALKRSVLCQIGKRRDEVVLGAAAGGDCAVLEFSGEEAVAFAVNPLTGAGEDIALPLIHRAANNLACSGAEPVGVLADVLLPEGYEEAELKKLMKRLEETALSLHMEIMGGHTEVLSAVNAPVLSVTGVGKVKKERRIAPGGGSPGQDVVLSKWIGIEGTALLARKREKELLSRFSRAFVGQAQEFYRHMSVLPEAAAAAEAGASALHDVSEGGIFNALWELAEASGVGLDIDLKKIPIRQETIEICEVFDVNPYFLPSGGALLMLVDNGFDFVRMLKLKGIPAQAIGKATDGNGRIIRNGDETRYIEPPRPENQCRIY